MYPCFVTFVLTLLKELTVMFISKIHKGNGFYQNLVQH